MDRDLKERKDEPFKSGCSVSKSMKSSFVMTVILPLGLYILGVGSGIQYTTHQIQEDLVNKGYAEYHNKTRAWQLCSADQIVLNTNSAEMLGEIPIGISTASSYIKFLLSQLKDYKQQVDICEKQLFEKDQLLEKARKKG